MPELAQESSGSNEPSLILIKFSCSKFWLLSAVGRAENVARQAQSSPLQALTVKMFPRVRGWGMGVRGRSGAIGESVRGSRDREGLGVKRATAEIKVRANEANIE